MSTTPLRGLYKPLPNVEIGWGAAVNANCDILDKVMVYQGSWLNSTAYRVNDIAVYNGTSYVCVQANTNQQPDISPTYWSVSGGSSKWNSLTAATGNLSLANAGFTTTFNQTSAINWTWANTTLATASVAQSSPVLNLQGQYWNGSASATDYWVVENYLGNGTNPTSILYLGHTGSPGPFSLAWVQAPGFSVPPNMSFGIPSDGTIGLFCYGNGNLLLNGNNHSTFSLVIAMQGNFQVGVFANSTRFDLLNSFCLDWCSAVGGTSDLGISRLAAGVLAIGSTSNTGDYSGGLILGALTQQTATPATATVSQSSPIHTFTGQYWNGSASALDQWTAQVVIANGTNGTSQLFFTHTGTAGGIAVNVPALTTGPLSLTGSSAIYFGSAWGYIYAGNTNANFTVGNTACGYISAGDPNYGNWVNGGGYRGFQISNGACYAFSANVNAWSGSNDTAISRYAANYLAVGNGNQGDGSATVRLGTLVATLTLSPTSAATAGTTGQIAWDTSNIYVCTAGGAAGAATWKKAALVAA